MEGFRKYFIMKKTSNKKKVKVSQLTVPYTVELPAAASVFHQTPRPSSSSDDMIGVDAQSYLSLGRVRRKLKTDSKLFTPEKSFLTPTPEESPAKAVNTIIDYNIPSPVDVFEAELVEDNEDSYDEDDNITKADDTGMIRKYAQVLGKMKIVEDFDSNGHVDEKETHNAEEENEVDEKKNQGDEEDKVKDQKEEQDPQMEEAVNKDADQREEQEAQKPEESKEIELKETKAWLGQTFGSSCCIS